MKQHGKWYDYQRSSGWILAAVFVMATASLMATALSAQTVVDFGRHCPTCDDPSGSHSRIAPVLTVPVWSDRPQSLDGTSGRAIEQAQVSQPPGKGGCTYECGTKSLGPPHRRRSSHPVTTAGSPV